MTLDKYFICFAGLTAIFTVLTVYLVVLDSTSAAMVFVQSMETILITTWIHSFTALRKKEVGSSEPSSPAREDDNF